MGDIESGNHSNTGAFFSFLIVEPGVVAVSCFIPVLFKTVIKLIKSPEMFTVLSTKSSVLSWPCFKAVSLPHPNRATLLKGEERIQGVEIFPSS